MKLSGYSTTYFQFPLETAREKKSRYKVSRFPFKRKKFGTKNVQNYIKFLQKTVKNCLLCAFHKEFCDFCSISLDNAKLKCYEFFL